MEAKVQEMSSQVTNNVYIINEVLHAQQSIKQLLTSLLPSNASITTPVATGTYNSVPMQTNTTVHTRPRVFSNPSGIAVAGAVHVASPRDHHSQLPSPPSWMTADTLLATTVFDAQNFQATECTNASADVSQSENVGGETHAPAQTEAPSPCTESARTAALTTSLLVDSRVSTRSRGTAVDIVSDLVIEEGPERSKCAPKEKADAIACTRACWILHPDAGDNIVGEGRAGGSWKCPTQKFGHLCSFGDQMVQVHRVFYGEHRLLHCEDRNRAFSTLSDAVVKPKYSNVYIKWDSRFLIAKPTKKNAPL